MKRITFFSTLLLFFLSISISYAQIVETFENETDGTAVFTSSGQSFTITNGNIENLVVGTGAGVGRSPQFIDNASFCGSQNTMSFSTTDGALIYLHSLHVYASTSCGGTPANSSLGVDVKGYKGGVETYSTTISNWTNERSNDFTLVDLAGLGHGNTLVDEIRLDFSSNAIAYVAIDEVVWSQTPAGNFNKENFNSVADNSTLFTNDGQSFTLLNSLQVFEGTPVSGYGQGVNQSLFYVDNFDASPSNIADGGTPYSASIQTTDGADFHLRGFYLYMSNNTGTYADVHSVGVTVNGYKDGAGTPVFTQVFSPPFDDENNGFNFIDISSTNEAKLIDRFEVVPANNTAGGQNEISYLAFDNFYWSKPVGGVTMSQQDLVVLQFNSDSGSDEFALLALEDIPSGTAFFVSDIGWDAIGGDVARTTEEAIKVTTSKLVTAGSIIRFDNPTAQRIVLEDTSIGTLEYFELDGNVAFTTTSRELTMTTSGDQLVIFQTADGLVTSAKTFIYAFSNDNPSTTNGWTDNGVALADTNADSHLFPSLVALDGTQSNKTAASAFSLGGLAGHSDNRQYTGPTTATTKDGWLTRIHTLTNWTSNDASVFNNDDIASGAPSVTISSCSAPTAQASSAVFGTETSTTLTLNSFTAPAGDAVTGYAIYINDSNSFTAPTDGTEPTADTSWNSSGQQPIYFGTSIPSNLQVTDLSSSTTYYFQIYAYNDCSGTETYETTGLNASDMTAAPPNVAPNFVTTAVTSVNQGDTYSYNVFAADANGDNVTLTAPTKPSWLTLIANTEADVSTPVGTGGAGAVDNTGNLASFNTPSDLVIDSNGNIFVADDRNNKIRKVTPAGVVTTFAGSGSAGSSDGTGTSATFNRPSGIAIDASDNLYVSDINTHIIRKITPAGVVTTFAGLANNSGDTDASGSSARFNFPFGLTTDSGGNVYVADLGNHKIRKITPAGVVSTFAGSGTAGSNDATGAAATFRFPYGVTSDSSDNIYVADELNHLIRKITPGGVVTTIAGQPQTTGSANGTGAAATFNGPRDLAVDDEGNIYVTDRDNHKIRKITPAGVVSDYAGDGTNQLLNGVGTAARFRFPSGIVIDKARTLYVTGQGSHTIRKITAASSTLSGDSSGESGDYSVTINANDGNGGSTDQSFTVTVLAAPTVTSSAASNVLANAAQLNGNVTNNGGSTITERGFVYALTSNDATPTLAEVNGTTVIKVVVSGTTGSFDETISGLTTGSGYSFVAFATNAIGSSESSVQTFTPTNTAPTFTSTPITSIDEGNAYNYVISTNDVDGHTVTVTAPTLPSWLTLNTSPTLSLTGDTTENAGDHNVTLRADDGNGGTTDQSFTITVNDVLSPTILEVGVVESSGTYKVGDQLQVFVQYNEAVTVTGTPRITLETGTTDRVIDYDSTSSSTVYFNYTVQAGDETSDLDVLGTNALDLNGGTIKDGAGNDAVIVLPFGPSTGGSISNGKDIVIDGVVPTVTSVGVPANGTYTSSQNLDFTVNFSENVSVNTASGTPQIAITIGSTTRQAQYQSGSGSSALLFRYTVLSGEQDLDGIAIGTLDANGGTLKDSAGNDANTTLNSVGNTSAVLVNSLPEVTLSASTNTIIENAGVSTITATLSAASVFDVTVNLAFTGTASGSGTDYNASGTSITISAGSTTGSITLTSVQDTLDENDETIIVDIDSVSGAVENTTQQESVTITDDDNPPTVDLTVNNSSIDEDGGIATLTATLSAVSGKDVTVNLGYSGTATSGVDYNATASTSIVITAGQMSADAAVTINATDDSSPETNETVIVDISGVVNGTENGVQQQTITIVDDDTPNISFDTASSNGLESTSSATIPVSLSIASPLTITVDWSVTGTATGGGTDFSLADGRLTFNANEVSKNITIADIVNDLIVETDETVIITLSDPSNANLGTISTYTYTINNDDSTVVTIDDSSANEDAVFGPVPIRLSNPVQGGFTLEFYTTDGTATTANLDYNAITTTLTFDGSAGLVDALSSGGLEDSVLEPDETFTIRMRNLGATSVNPANIDISDVATYTILNDDSAAVTIEDVNGIEDAGPITVTATLDNDVQGGFTIGVSTANGTATSPDDYAAITNQNIVFTGTAGETKTFQIIPVADSDSEPNETITVSMNNVVRSGDGLPDVTDTATVTIIDDDAPVVTNVSVPTAGNYALGDDLDFTVTFSNPVTITGTPSIPITIGSSTVNASLSGSVNSSVTATFRYTVQAGDSDDDGIAVGSAITLNGGTIIDGSSNAAILTLNNVGSTSDVDVDGIAPTATISTTAGSPRNASFDVTVSLSEVPTGFDLTDISVTNGSAGIFNQIDATTFSIRINPASDGQVDVQIPSSSFQDSFGNNNIASNTVSIIYDNTNPTVVITSDAPDPTNSSFTVTFTFSEDIDDFEDSYIELVNATVSNFTSTNAQLYTATINPISDGTVTVLLEEDAVTDFANNGILETSYSVEYDATNPTVAITSDASDPTNSNFTATFTFSEDVTGFELGDITVGNGTASNLQSTSASIYTAMITPFSDGNVTIDVAANVAQDAATNGNLAATQFVLEYDGTRPDALISSSVPSQVNEVFDVTITFTEDVTGFDVTDVTLSNATPSNFSGSGNTYSVTINPTSEGLVTIDVAENVAFDAATNGNTSATQLSVLYDITRPTVTITSDAPDPTNSSFTATFTFSEDVVGFIADDITVGNATVSNFSGSDQLYTATITPISDGNVTIDVAENVANDLAMNGNTAANQYSVSYDFTNPRVDISSTSPDPTNTTFSVDIVFSESVTGFELGDITVGNGTASNFAGSGTTYSATITPSADGTVTVDVGAGVASDAATNGNTAATQFSLVYDTTSPTVGISSTSPDPTNTTFSVDIVFSESVTGFELGDITVGNGVASNFAGSGTTYSATITPSSDGIITVDVGAGVANDAATNPNTAATQFSLEYDATSPTVILDSTAPDPVNTPFVVSILFDEDVFGFEMSDLVVTNGTPSGFTGSGFDYSVTITPSGSGDVTVEVPAGVATDAATNPNTSGSFTIEFDDMPPLPAQITHISEYTCTGNTAQTGDNTLEIFGTAERNSVVEVFIDGVSIGTVITDVDTGFFTFDYTGTTLADGSYTFTAQATDIAGNTGSLSVAFNIEVNTVDSDGDGNPDFCDDDDNGNGATDTEEDCDGDGIVNSQDTDNSSCTQPVRQTKSYGFSPNGDGINEGWVIPNITAFPNNVVSVYNRSGKLVFKQKNYQNDWQAVSNQVNGNTFGRKLPVGPYIYLIDFGDGSAPVRGWLYINY